MQHAQPFMRTRITPAISTKSRVNLPKEPRLIFVWGWAELNFFRKPNKDNGKIIAICFSNCVRMVLMLCAVAPNWNRFQFGVARNCLERLVTEVRKIRDKLGTTNLLCPTWFDARLNCYNTISTDIS